MPYYKFLRETIDKTLTSLVESKIIENCPEIFKYSIEQVPDNKFGQVSTNVLMINSKRSKISFPEFGNTFLKKMTNLAEFKNIKIVKPGFLNFEFENSFWQNELYEMLRSNQKIDKSKFKKKRVNIEFVSANPTGLMHIGHARGAILGDTIANLFTEAGYEVDRDYYINDAGNQIDVLVNSVIYYCKKLSDKNIKEPEEYYSGEYIENIAKYFLDNNDVINLKNNQKLRNLIVENIIKDIKIDLKNLGVIHNYFISEKEIATKDNVNLVIKKLLKKGLAYEGFSKKPFGKTDDNWKPEKQLLFKSESIDDDKDRTLIKPNGDLTYFMSDIIYHSTKIDRKYDLLLNVWGIDHSGYVKRIKNAIRSLFGNAFEFNIELTALVNLIQNKKPIKMSKRKGSFITLREVIGDVGKDVLRFMMVSRKADKVIDFDFDTVKEQSKDNPIFYVKYAHARCCSIERISKSNNLKDEEFEKYLKYLILPDEISIIIMLSNYLNILELCIIKLEPHRLTNYLYDLAKLFHNYYSQGSKDSSKRIILDNNKDLMFARVALIKVVKKIIFNGLLILNIKAPEKM